MSYQLYLNHELIPNPNFKTINLVDVTKLTTEDVVPVEIDLVTGDIFINHEPVRRIREYLAPGAKPIQYRRVVSVLGVYDFKAIKRVVDSQYHELLTKAEEGEALTIEELESLEQICRAIAGELPQHNYEEQILGYEYTVGDMKTKLEIISNNEPEVMSVVAKITLTDLTARETYEPIYKRLY